MKNKLNYTLSLSGKKVINYTKLSGQKSLMTIRRLIIDASQHSSTEVANMYTSSGFSEGFRGFTDAEGSFTISKVKEKFYSFAFEMKLHIDDINVLNYIQTTLGLGKVYKSNSSPTCKFVVTKQSELRKIIEFFSSNSLNSSKSLNFSALYEAFSLYTGGEVEGAKKSTENSTGKV